MYSFWFCLLQFNGGKTQGKHDLMLKWGSKNVNVFLSFWCHSIYHGQANMKRNGCIWSCSGCTQVSFHKVLHIHAYYKPAMSLPQYEMTQNVRTPLFIPRLTTDPNKLESHQGKAWHDGRREPLWAYRTQPRQDLGHLVARCMYWGVAVQILAFYNANPEHRGGMVKMWEPPYLSSMNAADCSTVLHCDMYGIVWINLSF